jgi:hypothetical protein
MPLWKTEEGDIQEFVWGRVFSISKIWREPKMINAQTLLQSPLLYAEIGDIHVLGRKSPILALIPVIEPRRDDGDSILKHHHCPYPKGGNELCAPHWILSHCQSILP